MSELTKATIDTIRDVISKAIKKGYTRTEIDKFLDNLITACIDLKMELPIQTHKKYIAERLNHLLRLLKDDDDIEDDIRELLQENQ